MTSSREEQHDFAACVLVLLCASAERHARPKADRKRQCQKPEGETCTSGFASQLGAAAVSEEAQEEPCSENAGTKETQRLHTRSSRSKQPARRREDDGKCTGFSSGILHLFGVLVSSFRFAC